MQKKVFHPHVRSTNCKVSQSSGKEMMETSRNAVNGSYHLLWCTHIYIIYIVVFNSFKNEFNELSWFSVYKLHLQHLIKNLIFKLQARAGQAKLAPFMAWPYLAWPGLACGGLKKNTRHLHRQPKVGIVSIFTFPVPLPSLPPPSLSPLPSAFDLFLHLM